MLGCGINGGACYSHVTVVDGTWIWRKYPSKATRDYDVPGWQFIGRPKQALSEME